jgi:hypothetical protein
MNYVQMAVHVSAEFTDLDEDGTRLLKRVLQVGSRMQQGTFLKFEKDNLSL